MFKKLTIVFVILIAGGNLFSQETIFDEVTVPFKKEILGGATLHSNGWGLNFSKGKYLSDSKKRMFGIEIVGMKSPKEVKTINIRYDGSRSYVYGKLNTFTILRSSFGIKKVLFDKIRKNGIEVSYEYGLGPSLGFTKPVYLEVVIRDDFFGPRLETEKYNPDEHFDNIYGRASSFIGLGELKIHPGGFAKFAMNFEYSGEKAGITALETGIVTDVYAKKIPIMAFEQNSSYFLTFYFKWMFGKKFLQ